MLGNWTPWSRAHRPTSARLNGFGGSSVAIVFGLLAPLTFPLEIARAQPLGTADEVTTVATTPSTTAPTAPTASVPSETDISPAPPTETGNDPAPEDVPTEPVTVPPPVNPGPPPPDSSLPQQIVKENLGKLLPSLGDAMAARTAAAQHVDTLTGDLGSLEARLARLGTDVQRPALQLLEARHHLRMRAVTSYMFTPAAPLDDALNATDVVDLSRRLAMMRSVLRADRAVVDEYQSAQDQISREMEDLVVRLEQARLAVTSAKSVLQAAETRVVDTQLQVEATQVGSRLLVGGFVSPVDGPTTFADTFGAPRMVGTPFAHLHQGTDIFAPAGTPLVAVERGVLLRVGTDVLGGTKLWLVGATGTRYFYAHLSALAEGTADGRSVEAGSVVGYVGNTGNARNTSPHLHFEVHPDGGPAVNPFPLLRSLDDAQRRRPAYPTPQLPPATPGPLSPGDGATPLAIPPLAPPGADEAGRRRAELELAAASVALETAKEAERRAAEEVSTADGDVRRADAQLAGHGVEEQAAAQRLAEARGRLRDLAIANYVTGGPVGPTVYSLAGARNADELARRTVLVRSASAVHRSVTSSYQQAHQAASRQVDRDLRVLDAAKAEREIVMGRLRAAGERVRSLTAELDNRRLLLELVTSAGPVLPSDIPRLVLDAYRKASAALQHETPSCGLGWTAIAAVGKVESDHGRFGNTQLALNGDLFPRILGIPLDGTRTALISDSDGGKLDEDLVHDRAVGPMQFIPSTWSRVARDGNGDGVADPHNAYDAVLGAATYLCRAVPTGRLDGEAGLRAAFFSYNHSNSYVEAVLAWVRTYDSLVPHMPPDPAASA